VLLTGGERGTPSGVVDPQLKAIRRSEAQRAARILGVARVIQEDFGDGRLREEAEEVRPSLSRTIRQIDPDLILTHDRAGLYGHPDHIACSEMVTELRNTLLPGVPLWYVALPTLLLRTLQLAGQMARDPPLDASRATPSHRLFLGTAVVSKARALRAYQSQRGAIGKRLGRLVPPWIAVSVLPFEYFAEV
jgi:LmbE family N-acetylglucosaminyl deacetylase